MIHQLFDQKLLRFRCVGVINTIIGAGTMFALYNLAGCSYWVSSACNYIVGGTVSYFLNKYFTFEQKKKDVKYICRFVLNTLLCYLAAYGVAKPLVLALPLHILGEKWLENIAMAVGMCLYTVLGYIGQRFFVFL